MTNRIIAFLLMLTALIGCLCSCGSSETDTVLRVAVEGGSVDDGLRGGRLKPVFAEIAERLDVTVLSATPDEADIIIAGIDTLASMADSLLCLDTKKESLPFLYSYLRENGTVRLSAVIADDDPTMLIAPVAGKAAVSRAPLIRADIVRHLLDGEGVFASSVGKTVTETCYTPQTTLGEDIAVTVIENGELRSILRSYSAGGNIIEIMNIHAGQMPLDGVTAVNMLRSYIDDAYGGYYGIHRSELFIGERAAYSADELVALLRCVMLNSHIFGNGAECGIFIPEGEERMLLELIGTMLGIRGMGADSFMYLNAEGELCDARLSEEAYSALEVFATLISEELVSIGASDGFMTYGDILGEDSYTLSGYTPIYPPISRWNMGTDGDEYMRFVENNNVIFDTGIGINAENAGKSREKLDAALAFLDFVYTPEGQQLVTAGGKAAIGITDPSELLDKSGAGYLCFDGGESQIAYLDTEIQRAVLNIRRAENMSLISHTHPAMLRESAYIALPEGIEYSIDGYNALRAESDCTVLIGIMLYGWDPAMYGAKDPVSYYRDKLMLSEYLEEADKVWNGLLGYYEKTLRSESHK